MLTTPKNRPATITRPAPKPYFQSEVVKITPFGYRIGKVMRFMGVRPSTNSEQSSLTFDLRPLRRLVWR